MRRRLRFAGTAALALALLVGACQKPSKLSLTPLEQPVQLQPATPRVSGAIPRQQRRERVLESRGTATEPHLPPQKQAAAQPGDITLDFVDTDIREIARAILGKTLKVNYTIDPSVHGTASLETGKPLSRAALLPTLESLLNQNGATLIEKHGVYAVVPIAAGTAINPVASARTIGAGVQVVPLRYASAEPLAKLLAPYVAPGGKIAADPTHNALIVSGSAAARQALVALIKSFDINLLAGQSYALFPAGDRPPAMLAGELEKVMHAQGGGSLSGVVHVLPLERVNAVLVITPQARYLDAARRFLRLSRRAEDETARTWHVYYVQNGKAANLEYLLQRAFTPGHVSPTPPPPGATAPGAQQTTLGGKAGAGFGFSRPGGTAGSTGETGSRMTLPTATTGSAGSASTAATATKAETQPPATEALSAPEGGKETENRIRIVADRVNNSLLIYATPSEYGVVAGMLRKIDVVPLQVLIDATIAEVTLNSALQYGTQFFFKVDHVANQLYGAAGPTLPSLAQLPTVGGFTGFVLSKAPRFALEALASVTKVNVLSSPQVMVLDNQAARLQVGQQVPVLTQTSQSTLTNNAPIVNSVDYRDTGVILQVTPRVNSGGLVTLDIGQEVSNVTQQATNTVQGSPTFDDRVIHTRVAVQDGQTLGLAGLIQDTSSKGNSGIPWLKDIPILGTLVSNQNNERTRRELLVLITPHVVHDQRDARALTEDLRSELIHAALVPQEQQREQLPGRPNPNGL